MQWLKSYFDRVTASQGVGAYDAVGRRAATKDGGGGSRGGMPGPRSSAGISAKTTKCDSLTCSKYHLVFTHGSCLLALGFLPCLSDQKGGCIEGTPLSFPHSVVDVQHSCRNRDAFVALLFLVMLFSGECRTSSVRPGSSASKSATAAAVSSPSNEQRSTTSAAMSSASNARELQQRIIGLQEELAVAKQQDSDTAQERDFYFSKLREIELLCQQEGVKEQWDIMQGVENILYAATEEEGTQARESALQALPQPGGAA